MEKDYLKRYQGIGTNLHELLGGQSECHRPVVVITDNLGRVASLPQQFLGLTQNQQA